MSLPISNTEHVYRQLRRQIITGELAPGERLLIRGLCERFGTSNSPVIEAIRRLEQEGLVLSRTNAGAQVKEWNTQDLVRSYLTRSAVDGMAARLFVDCATQEQRDKLVELNEGFNRAARGEDIILLREADAAYHLYVISCTLSLPIQKAMESVYAVSMTFFGNNSAFSSPFVENQHDEMTEVFLGSDPDAAENLVRDAMRGVLRNLVERGIIDQKDIPASIEEDMLVEAGIA
jgi:DNA-binding GntR family transcriptional regulator